ncbi:MAG: hypothetical protein JNL41_06855 [Phenylobacterium sp.]|uniref:hypothetical protein n=1 Tax=Phenylobacterium sp. TaxID=1871053 RepID=UPI001A553786|nr:hypothetical protein [Phenylobacterium sp.]MBL8553981.1 hypothetical protein [Phenylobacterium sp.]
MKRRTLCLFAFAALAAGPARAENGERQGAEAAYRPTIADPRHAPGAGARICNDEAHHNFHRLDGRFAAFAAVLRADGYRLSRLDAALRPAALRRCDVLVIANALPSDGPWEDYPRPTPPAFTAEEVGTVRRWVAGGGRLLLIADHRPLAGAAASLAEAFGFHFTDGYALALPADAPPGAIVPRMPDLFTADAGALRRHPITDGRLGGPPVTQVATFIGQAFRADPGAQPLLVLPEGFVSLDPARPWAFDAATPRQAVRGWLQGATRKVGRGRVAVFGEAAMFTAQVAANGQKMGLDAPGAEQNVRFLRNVIAWLAAAG